MNVANAPVFDAGVPLIVHHHLHNRDEAHRIIGRARQQAPIAMGPYEPGVLSNEPAYLRPSAAHSYAS
jgi:hypothetical protein